MALNQDHPKKHKHEPWRQTDILLCGITRKENALQRQSDHFFYKSAFLKAIDDLDRVTT